MPKVSPEELETLTRKELHDHMRWIEELFSVARSQTSRPSADRLKVVRSMLQFRVVKISNFLDAYHIRH